jgi:hypothetical protein
VGKRRTVGWGSDRDEAGARLHDVHCKCFKSEFVFPFLFRFVVADDRMDPNFTMFQNQGDPAQYVAGSSAEHPPATFDYSTMDVQHGYEQVVLSVVVDSVVSLASYFMHDSYIKVMLFCS